jgi:hypothetical protein
MKTVSDQVLGEGQEGCALNAGHIFEPAFVLKPQY